MRIKKLRIRNFKSLVDFQLDTLPKFGVIVGPNASGKSNIFEALEFTNYIMRFAFEATTFFGGKERILSYGEQDIISPTQAFQYDFADNFRLHLELMYHNGPRLPNAMDSYGIGSDAIHEEIDISPLELRNIEVWNEVRLAANNQNLRYDDDFEIFINNFSRIFVGKKKLVRASQAQSRLAPDASNVAQILSQILQDENKKEDFIEWLRILIPEFSNLEVKQSNLDGSFEFFLYEKTYSKPFTKQLISDGTFNILAILAAVFQSDQPQFLCIEEPENGLHPQVIQLLVEFLREKCEDEGHHILLNTHSQTLVRCLKPQEMILINKENGKTIARQLTDMHETGIMTDEAWLSNALGGGTLSSK